MPEALLILKIQTHEKNRTDFKTRCRADYKKRSALQQIEEFFQFSDLAASKERLNSIMNHAVSRNSWINEDPVVIFQFQQAVRSFIHAGYLIMLKERKQAVKTQLENGSPLALGLLSEKEYKNPQLVFQKAFMAYNIRE